MSRTSQEKEEQLVVNIMNVSLVVYSFSAAKQLVSLIQNSTVGLYNCPDDKYLCYKEACNLSSLL